MTANCRAAKLNEGVRSSRNSIVIGGGLRHAPAINPLVADRQMPAQPVKAEHLRKQQAMQEITQVLEALDRGQPVAASELLPLVYDELRKIAARKLAQERPGHTLDPTALVHEAYLRLVQDGKAGPPRADDPIWANRRHFFAAAAEAMRRILVENARRKRREKHGGGLERQHVDLDACCAIEDSDSVLSLHAALERFAELDPLKAKLVELRFFGGLTLGQSADCLGISESTADRAWKYGRAWLYAAMANDDSQTF
jgi:RNA polymerase sigma factor (TIGR02999 family)